VLRMTLQHVATPGRRLALDAVYPDPGGRPPARRRPAPRTPASGRLPADLPRTHAADGGLRRLGPADLRLRRRARVAPGPRPGDGPQGPAGQPPRTRTPRTAPQRRPPRRTPRAARAAAPAGHRPDPHPVPRPAPPGRRRAIPRRRR